ncbi:hypothetical protein Ssi03_05190 [Sphaerisporangium siamense]|uniref:Putative coiled-coil protein SlyX n=1 Tax=Sphaerisporangium siamense TaxID=795645 RepID=A0A7W7DC11_9ACTN|nr:hypothetical protein [Sphaerisporangium siamense]MBB4704054.1 putative coiled-coil protein SlyX [Sphaerisporangium siamense]GII82529.1 hypothetical protein Ssi03_05190 [Sphaerisporangium siamense]
MARQIAAYQPPSPLDLEARVQSLEMQVASLTEAVRTLSRRVGDPDATGSD